METRTATLNDLDAICRLGDEINRLHHARHPAVFAEPDDLIRDRNFWSGAITAEQGNILVAVDRAQVVGFVSVKIIDGNDITFLKPRTICRIGTIVVSSAHRRRGVGRALMVAVQGWAHEKSAVEIRLEVFKFNQAAMSFYEQFGFEFQSHIMVKAIVD